MKMNALDWTSFVLLVVGGLNWGLVAINSNYNVVEMLFGSWPIVVTIVYGLVGLSALYSIYHMFTSM